MGRAGKLLALPLALAALLAAAPARPGFTAAEWGGAALTESENE